MGSLTPLLIIPFPILDQELILPDSPLFKATLESSFPPNWKTQDIVKDSSTGLLKSVTRKEALEYIYDGEYDEACNNFGEEED